jgi:hypothetical protein
LLPAHGDPVTDPHRLVRGMLNHRLQRERQLVRLLEEGGPSPLPPLVARAYPGLDPRLVPAAEATALAHLLALEQQGRVVRSDDRWRTSE